MAQTPTATTLMLRVMLLKKSIDIWVEKNSKSLS